MNSGPDLYEVSFYRNPWSFLSYTLNSKYHIFLMSFPKPGLPELIPFCTFLVQVLITFYIYVKLFMLSKYFQIIFYLQHSLWDVKIVILPPTLCMRKRCSEALSNLPEVAQLINKDQTGTRTQASCSSAQSPVYYNTAQSRIAFSQPHRYAFTHRLGMMA